MEIGEGGPPPRQRLRVGRCGSGGGRLSHRTARQHLVLLLAPLRKANDLARSNLNSLAQAVEPLFNESSHENCLPLGVPSPFVLMAVSLQVFADRLVYVRRKSHVILPASCSRRAGWPSKEGGAVLSACWCRIFIMPLVVEKDWCS